jgi:MerR family transcriptional regulator, thiopeptide resistance regulator
MNTWKVGELARRSGLTVRTLHHYDEIGLLSPSQRSQSGHRLYADRDVVRLQQIVSLRQLGFTLEQIGECLARPRFSALRVIEMHIAQLQEQINKQRGLAERLQRIAGTLRERRPVSADEFLTTIEAIAMYEKHFTPEEMERIKKRGEVVGAERIKEVEAEWPKLIAEVRAEMEQGTDPKSPKVQALAKRWMALVNEFTGGDNQIAQKVKKMYNEEPQVQQRSGLDPKIFAYVNEALK